MEGLFRFTMFTQYKAYYNQFKIIWMELTHMYVVSPYRLYRPWKYM